MQLSSNFYPSPSDADQQPDSAQFHIPTHDYVEAGGHSKSMQGHLQTTEFTNPDIERIRGDVDQARAETETLGDPETLADCARVVANRGDQIQQLRIQVFEKHLLSEQDVTGRNWL